MGEETFSVPGRMGALVLIVGVVREGAGIGYWLGQGRVRSK